MKTKAWPGATEHPPGERSYKTAEMLFSLCRQLIYVGTAEKSDRDLDWPDAKSLFQSSSSACFNTHTGKMPRKYKMEFWTKTWNHQVWTSYIIQWRRVTRKTNIFDSDIILFGVCQVSCTNYPKEDMHRHNGMKLEPSWCDAHQADSSLCMWTR